MKECNYKEIKEKIKGVLPCICTEGHKERNLNDPNCPKCVYYPEIEAILEEYLVAEEVATTEKYGGFHICPYCFKVVRNGCHHNCTKGTADESI